MPTERLSLGSIKNRTKNIVNILGRCDDHRDVFMILQAAALEVGNIRIMLADQGPLPPPMPEEQPEEVTLDVLKKGIMTAMKRGMDTGNSGVISKVIDYLEKESGQDYTSNLVINIVPAEHTDKTAMACLMESDDQDFREEWVPAFESRRAMMK